jgi:NAD(P)-dependent dehydrogenase (short-subunit alcohol dehydrogenase family)
VTRFDLSNRIAVITGGGSGIGLACAERFLRSGAAVEVWGIEGEVLERARATLAEHGRVSARIVDISRWDEVEAASQRTLAEYGRVDILVNSAGIADSIPTFEMKIEDWHRSLRVNLDGVFYACRAFGPAMVSRGYGRIINLASMAGKEGNSNQVAYSAGKAGVIGLTKSLGKELATSGVTVNAVAPTIVDTPLVKSMLSEVPEAMAKIFDKIPMHRMGTPAEAAALITWIASDECSFTTGFTFDLSGGRAVY